MTPSEAFHPTPFALHGILHGSSCHAQGAAARLKQGAELLTKRLEQDDSYFSAAAELQKHWKLKVSLRKAFHSLATFCARISGGGLEHDRPVSDNDALHPSISRFPE